MFVRVHFFLLLNGIPLYGYTSVCSSIRLLMYFIGCLWLLSVLNKAAINIDVPVFGYTYIFISFGKYLGLDLLAWEI